MLAQGYLGGRMTYHDGVGVEAGGQFAQQRGPALAGGVEHERFRRVHGHGLFPPDIVKNRDFAALNAWLQSLPRAEGRD